MKSKKSEKPLKKDESSFFEKKAAPKPSLKAKKDFVIHQNDFHLEIKEGDDLSRVPDKFLQNLKTEGVV